MPAQERRRLVVLGSVLGVLIAIFVAKSVFSKSDSTSTPGFNSTSITNPFAPKLNATTTTLRHHAKPPATATSAPPPNFQVYGTKNPFEPVIQVENPTTPTTARPRVTTTTSVGAGTTTTTVAPSNNPGPGQTVTLVDIYRDAAGTVKAHVQVASTVYTVGEGTTFANGAYRVVSLDLVPTPCGQFLFGDSPFRLCQGEQTLK